MRLNLLLLLCSELQRRLDPISLDWFIYPPISCYLWFSYIRFVFMMFFKTRCIWFSFWRSKFSALLDQLLHRTLFHGFDTLGSHMREEGSLDYDEGFVRLQVHLKFNTNIHRPQAPFSGAVAREQVIKIRSFIAFCVIFSFLLVFIFHLLTFDHPQNQSNLVCLT
jgi:hypothetical protein